MRNAKVKIASLSLGNTLKADYEAAEKEKPNLENNIIRVRNCALQQHS